MLEGNCVVYYHKLKNIRKEIFFYKNYSKSVFLVLPYVSAYIVLSIDIISKGTRFKSGSVRTPSFSIKWQGGT